MLENAPLQVQNQTLSNWPLSCQNICSSFTQDFSSFLTLPAFLLIFLFNLFLRQGPIEAFWKLMLYFNSQVAFNSES